MSLLTSLRRPSLWMTALLLVIIANSLFAMLAISTVRLLTPEPLLQRVRNAFDAGELVERDYLFLDSKRGFHQYNDCLILQLITNRSGDSALDAFGPILYVENEEYKNYCRTLKVIAYSDAAPRDFLVERYTRYWHGYNPVSAALLSWFELSDVRRLLKSTVYAALALLGFAAAARGRALFGVAAAIAATAVLFWGVREFGQSLCHGPGDAVVILGIASLLLWHRLSVPDVFVPFCAVYGSVVVYFEFLTGLLPTAAGLLLILSYLVYVQQHQKSGTRARGEAWIFAVAGVVGFVAGGALTVVVKQILSLALIGPQALQSFVHSALAWSSPAATHRGSELTPVVGPIAVFLRCGWVLTYGSKSGTVGLYCATAVAWVGAAWLAARAARSRTAVSDLAAFVAGATVPAIWFLLMQTHSVVHGFYMVRMLIVPISLGWGALTWQLLVDWNERYNSSSGR